MKKIINNNNGSVYGVAVYIGVLGFASFLVLLFSHILEPFFSIMPVGNVRDILLLIYPYGILLVILIVMSSATLMYYQKKFYQEGGGT